MKRNILFWNIDRSNLIALIWEAKITYFVLVKNVYLFSQLFKFSLKFSLNLV